MTGLAQWLAGTPLSHAIQAALWLIPLLQTVHILAIAMVMGSVAMLDLRLLGFAQSQSMSETAHRFLPWVWCGLVMLLATGILQIIGEPKRTLDHNPAFQIKLLLLLLAIGLTLAFQASLQRNLGFWERDRDGRRIKRTLACLTFLIWGAILIAGRWIAYMRTE